MKKTIIMALMAVASVSASAQQKQTIEIPSWLSNVKLSGYGMTQYQYNGQKDAESNSFNIRMARISLEGRIAGDFYWKTQIQFNGNTSTLGSSPRMVDLFAEWQKYEYFKVKIGQFKNPFTFENPMHPIDQGFMGYSTGEVVFERIFSSAVIMAGIVGGVFLVWGGIEWYRKIWDDIYKMVLIASFSFIAVLGNLIREYLPFNLLFVIFVINVGTVLIRIYLNNKNVGY